MRRNKACGRWGSSRTPQMPASSLLAPSHSLAYLQASFALLSLLLFVLGGSPFTRTPGTTVSYPRVSCNILREEFETSAPELAWAWKAVSCNLSPHHVLSLVSFAKHRCHPSHCFPMRGAGTYPRGDCSGLVPPGSGDAAGLTQSPPTTSLSGSQPAPLSVFPEEIRVYQAGSRPGVRLPPTLVLASHVVTHVAHIAR